MDMVNRIRKPKNVTLDPDLVEAMTAWCKSQDVKVDFGPAVDVAIREFLKKRGALPKKCEAEFKTLSRPAATMAKSSKKAASENENQPVRKIGYARVSTADREFRHLISLEAFG